VGKEGPSSLGYLKELVEHQANHGGDTNQDLKDYGGGPFWLKDSWRQFITRVLQAVTPESDRPELREFTNRITGAKEKIKNFILILILIKFNFG